MTTGRPDDVEAEATRPPWTLTVPVAEITRPPAEPIGITVPPAPAVITVAWPRGRVVQDRPPLVPSVLRLAARPQRPVRQPCPQLRNMDLPPPAAKTT
jgi:hypothetical protein